MGSVACRGCRTSGLFAWGTPCRWGGGFLNSPSLGLLPLHWDLGLSEGVGALVLYALSSRTTYLELKAGAETGLQVGLKLKRQCSMSRIIAKQQRGLEFLVSGGSAEESCTTHAHKPNPSRNDPPLIAGASLSGLGTKSRDI